ncbi:serine hydroxymethyltransferase, partial [Patescibacteria group bacterium]|nr:serine hydroxymethyltransferase [Patescibacteria group bacterium]
MSLKTTDNQIYKLIKLEEKRQKDQLQMIPSENYTSKAVREAVGSVVMNKYSEGQPFKRYYQGNQYIDEVEALTKERALKLFGLDPTNWTVNVQAANGSTANLAVYLALLELGDKILGMYLYDGGHLSHGWKLPDGKVVSMTSKLFSPHYYKVNPKTGIIDYENLEQIAKKVKPKILISGGTAYPREINHEKMGQIAHSIGALYMADIAHEAG